MISRRIAEARRLREPLDSSDAHRHHKRIQLCSVQDTLDKKESDVSALAVADGIV